MMNESKEELGTEIQEATTECVMKFDVLKGDLLSELVEIEQKLDSLRDKVRANVNSSENPNGLLWGKL